MASHWLDNGEATKRVKELLLKAGLPLEVRTAQACQQFVKSHTTSDSHISFSCGRVVYEMDDLGEISREIDQCITLELDMQVMRQMYIQFILEMPIECKHRDGLEVFGFPYQDDPNDFSSYPIMSNLIGSRFISQLKHECPEIITKEPFCAISLLEIEGGKTPRRVSEENLIYKAGSSLYDYIKTSSYPMPEMDKEILVQEMGLFGPFQNYRAKTIQYYWHYAMDTLDKWSDDVFLDFNRRYFSDIRYGFPLFIRFPIICLDSPLYVVDFADSGEIIDFKPREILLTGIRVPSWPGKFHNYLVQPTPEPMLIITNPQKLPLVLESVYDWFASLPSSLLSNPNNAIRMPLEASIFRHIVNSTRQRLDD